MTEKVKTNNTGPMREKALTKIAHATVQDTAAAIEKPVKELAKAITTVDEAPGKGPVSKEVKKATKDVVKAGGLVKTPGTSVAGFSNNRPVSPWGDLWDEYPPTPLVPVVLTPLDPKTQLTVKGVPVEPLAVDVRSNGGHITAGGFTVFLPYPSHRYEGMTFSAYHITGRRQSANNPGLFVLLDNQSTLEISDVDFHYLGRSGNRRQAAVVLVNSSSKNDDFFGENYLINVSTEKCVLNESRVEARFATQGHTWEYHQEIHEQHGWNGRPARQPEAFITGHTERHRYEECQFKRSTILDSKLPEGFYSSANIVATTIKGSGSRANVSKSEVKFCDFSGVGTKITSCELTRVGVHVTGAINMTSQRLSKDTLHASALYLPNKFSRLEVTLPGYSDLVMLRINGREFELANSGPYEPVKLNAEAKREEITAAVHKYLKHTAEFAGHGEIRNNPFTDSLVNYVVDSIESRLRVVSMLDSSTAVVRAIGQDSHTYDSPYGD